MVGYHQSEAALPRTGKCICIHGFISLSHAAACISLFSISSSLAEPGGDEVTTVTAVRDWTIHSITKHDKHFTKTSSKQIAWRVCHFWWLFFFVILRNFHSHPSIPTVGLHLRTQWMRFPLQYKWTNKTSETSDDNLRAAFKQKVTCRKSFVTATNKHIFNIPLFQLNPNGKYFGFHLPTIEIWRLRFTTVAVRHMTATVSASVIWTRTTHRPLGCNRGKGYVF